MIRHLRQIKGRWYFQPSRSMIKAGFRRCALGNDKTTAASYVQTQNAEWDEIRQQEAEPAIPATMGDFNWLINRFQKDPTWYASKSLPTQSEMDYAFKFIADEWGTIRVRILQRRHARAFYNEMRAEKGFSVHKTRKIMKWAVRLLAYAVEIGCRDDNPAQRLTMEIPRGRDQVWTASEIAAVIKVAETGSKASSGNKIPPRPSIALATRIAYDTSLPQQDILALQWPQFDGQGLAVRQIKPRGDQTELWLPLSRETIAVMEKMKKTSTHIIVSEETKKPYTDRNVFSRIFRRFRDRAGARSDLTFHDLRRTALTEFGNRGATNAEIVKFSGHDINSRVLKTYVRPDRTAAENAARKRWNLDES